MSDPHTLWAVAQLVPGEGIEDGVARIAALLGESDCRACEHYPVCASMPTGRLICTNADRYDPLPPVRLWRAA